MWSQIFDYLKEQATIKTILPTIVIVLIVGFITERQQRSYMKRNWKKALKKVALPADSERRQQPQPKPASPLSLSSSRIQQRRISNAIVQDYDTIVALAIANAKLFIAKSNLTEVLPDELYDFISSYHPRHQPSAKFLTAVTCDTLEYGDYDWGLYLRRRRSKRRYRSFNEPEQPDPQMPNVTDPQSLSNSKVSTLNIEQDHDIMMSGCVAPQHLNAREWLKARIEPEDNEAVCTGNHPDEARIQRWRLISKSQLPFNDLFNNPEWAWDNIPDQFYTTCSGLCVILEGLRKACLTDEVILESLMKLGSDLGTCFDRNGGTGRPLVDAEYMQSYYPESQWTKLERRHWTVLHSWRRKALSDLGIWMLEDGSYITAGEIHFNEMGWEM